MKINKPKFWDIEKSFLSLLFSPLSFLVSFFVFIKRKMVKVKEFEIPIICVGNIYLGGTGKTPLSIFLANQLLKKGRNPIIVRKFYKKHFDEHTLIKKKFKSLIINKDRIFAVKEAEKNGYDLVILDDGFQDYKVKKNLSIICFNQLQKVGNGKVIPSGPLRESLERLVDAQIVVINGKRDSIFEKKILEINKKLDIYYSNYFPTNVKDFTNKKLIAFAGIGNPDNFFDLLSENNLNIVKKITFPDHYKYKKSEITDLINHAKKNNFHIITTEKDYYRIEEFDFKEINFLKIEFRLSEKEKFLKRISNVYD